MVFQKPNPFPKSIYDNVAYGPRVTGMKVSSMDDLVEESLRGAALWDEVKDKLKQSAYGLSGGQQQRLCIARTIAVRPEVILMDEPCSALDPIATARIEDLMEDLRKDFTIIIVTHNMQQAARVADRTAFFTAKAAEGTGDRTGQLVEFDLTSKIFSNPNGQADRGLHLRSLRLIVVAAADELEAAPMTCRPSRLRKAAWWGSGALSVLVADEDPAARAEFLRLMDGRAEVTVCGTGAEALWQAGRIGPAVVVLSATLPVVAAADVVSVLCRHRQGPMSIAVGIGVGETEQAAPVLAAGANRVMNRPYQSREVEPLLREHLAGELHQREILAVGALELNVPAFEVWAAGRELRLKLREFELLRLLMVHADSVVSQQHIREELWEARGESVRANTIAVHIRRLRSHVDGVADILSVRGVGYRLRAGLRQDGEHGAQDLQS